jgi:hypothetical protein
MKKRSSNAGRGRRAAGLLIIGLSVMAAAIIAMGGCTTFQSIELTPPAKTVFAQGEEFSYDGLQVTGVTKKGDTKDISGDSKIRVRGYNPDRIGDQTITVEYRDIKAAYTVTVVGVEGITINAAPKIARQGLDIDRSALRVTASYGGTVAARPADSNGLNISGYNKNTVGEQTVTAEYYGKTAAFTVTVAPLTGIKIRKPPVKVTYFDGEPLDLAGIEAAAAWQGAGEAPVTPEYVSGFDSSIQGDQTVIVEALGKQASFTVTVKEPGNPDKWTPVQANFAKNITTVLYGNGKFVAAGYNDNSGKLVIASSPDGITWTPAFPPDANGFPKNIAGIAYGNGKFVVAGYEDDKNTGYVSDKIVESIVAYSTDGITWRKAATPGNFRNKTLFFGDGKFFAIGDFRYPQTGNTDIWETGYYVVESFDGVSWSDRNNIPSWGRGQGAYNGAAVSESVWDNIRYVFSDGSKFIALYDGGYGNMYLYSTNPKSVWKPGERPIDINGRPIAKVVFGNGKFVGVGRDAVGWSIDGITWTDADYKGEKLRSGNLNGVAYGFGMFVAVNSRGNIIYSRDGYTWTKVASSTFGSIGIRDVAYGGGKFVAVGENGRIAYSNKVD